MNNLKFNDTLKLTKLEKLLKCAFEDFLKIIIKINLIKEKLKEVKNNVLSIIVSQNCNKYYKKFVSKEATSKIKYKHDDKTPLTY